MCGGGRGANLENCLNCLKLSQLSQIWKIVSVTSVLTGQCVGLNTAKTKALWLATLAININLDMMGYFDFFLSFTDKNSCFEINIDEFWWKRQHI